MDEVESTQGSPAEWHRTQIHRQSAVVTQRGKIDDLNAVLFGVPAPLTNFEMATRAVTVFASNPAPERRLLQRVRPFPGRGSRPEPPLGCARRIRFHATKPILMGGILVDAFRILRAF
jgi:hypothetical protein